MAWFIEIKWEEHSSVEYRPITVMTRKIYANWLQSQPGFMTYNIQCNALTWKGTTKNALYEKLVIIPIKDNIERNKLRQLEMGDKTYNLTIKKVSF